MEMYVQRTSVLHYLELQVVSIPRPPLLTLCIRSADLYAYVINLAHAKCT